MAKFCKKKKANKFFGEQKKSRRLQKAIARFRNLYNYQLQYQLKLLFGKNHEKLFELKTWGFLQMRLSSCKSVQNRYKIINTPPLNCSTKENLKKRPCTVLQLIKEGWTKLFAHLSRASDHLIMECFTSLKPPYIMRPVLFGFFVQNLGKTMFL